MFTVLISLCRKVDCLWLKTTKKKKQSWLPTFRSRWKKHKRFQRTPFGGTIQTYGAHFRKAWFFSQRHSAVMMIRRWSMGAMTAKRHTVPHCFTTMTGKRHTVPHRSTTLTGKHWPCPAKPAKHSLLDLFVVLVVTLSRLYVADSKTSLLKMYTLFCTVLFGRVKCY